MTFDQIRAGLASLGWDEPLEDDEVNRALTALVGWGLLEATQDHSARYATPEEFERRNLNWSLTQHGIAAIGGLLHALEMLRRAVSLQPAVLDAIADGLHELHSLLTDETPDPARVATRLAEVESHMASLVSNVRQFNSHLQRLMREDATDDDVFLDVKERTVTYLQEFVNGVDRPVRRVALNVRRIEGVGVAILLDLALTGANLAPVPGEDPAPGWQADRWKRWEALRAWFAPTDASDARSWNSNMNTSLGSRERPNRVPGGLVAVLEPRAASVLAGRRRQVQLQPGRPRGVVNPPRPCDCFRALRGQFRSIPYRREVGCA